jgi:hypothetical protein
MDLEGRVAKVEKRIEATTKLVHLGMKLLVKMQQETIELKKAQKETTEKINMLIDVQMALGGKIDRLVDSWAKNRGNGHRS